jgi:hypothetical protein
MVEANTVTEAAVRFVRSLFGTSLANNLRITPSGLFVPETEREPLISAYQVWLKADSGAAGLLESSRCIEHLFGSPTPTDFYVLDGKNCLVGNLIKIETNPELKTKFPVYAGTPIDGRNSIHPKDPMLSKLPEGIQIQNGPDGMEIRLQLKTILIQLPLSRLPDIAYLVGNSPRLRKQKYTFKQALRKVVPELALLLKQARPVNTSSLRFLPSQFRRQGNVKFLALADLILALNSQGRFISGFGFKAKNMLDFLHTEIKILSETVRSKRIGEFDLRTYERNCAGILRSKNEKFSLEYRALMDFVQIWRPNKTEKRKSESPTLFDILRELSLEFSHSAWTLERDISPRFRGSSKDNLNYRTTKGWVFWISKRAHLVSLRRRPQLENKSPVLTAPLVMTSVVAAKN